MITLLRGIGIAALLIIAVPLFLIIVIPLALISKIWFKGRKCTPEELAYELDEIAAGRMDGWDQIECVPLADTRLEAIRGEAMWVNLPLLESDKAKLTLLAAKARALKP